MLAGLTAAARTGLAPVKINAVLMRGVNDHEAPGAAAVLPGARVPAAVHRADAARRPARLAARRHGHRRRDHGLAERGVHPEAGRLRRPGSAPAEAFLVDGGPATVGIIASVTRPFCGSCDRVRLTADGQVRNCLFAREESDLRGLLRAGASDDDLARSWQRAVAGKLPGHGINDPGFLQPARPMSAIGG